ncbi:4270_t:CDS:2 [Funneliformis geosporum]|uniref:5209_t:CDS:1 n=1 Tax=Funneliformis geosporum TaxID=1117311 RepID=A0A9W4WUJ1_9GLOM|nr:4270_t:CDS:2 [Funneliformis geosporum]CAI2187982.1 5209_t:CDS:2 [Funneliformis geosporum]
MADQYIKVPSSSINNNYANISSIGYIAERTGVHAIWADCVTQTEFNKQGHIIISESVYKETCVKDVNDGLNKPIIIGFPP